MKKKYVWPEMELILLESADVITTSDDTEIIVPMTVESVDMQ